MKIQSILFLSIFLSIGCSNSESTSFETMNDGDKYISEMFKSLDDITYQSFRKYFISPPDFNTFHLRFKAKTAHDKVLRKDNSYVQILCDGLIAVGYNEVMKFTVENDVKWTDIEISDIEQSIKKEDGVDFYIHDITIEYENEEYTVKTYSGETKDGYSLLRIKRFYKK